MKQVFKVHTGDTTFYFQMDKLYREPYLKKVFKKKIRQCATCTTDFELFPGLVLEDGKGKLWKPELQVHLVPFEPEE